MATRKTPIDEATTGAGLPKTPKKRIGEILVDMGCVSVEQVNEALENAADVHLQLGARLVNAGFIDDVKLARALGVRLGVGFTDLSNASDVDAEAVALVPERIARRFKLIPTKLDGGTLSIAMVNPGNVFAIDAVRAATGLRVLVLAAPEGAVRKALDRYYAFGLDLESSAAEMDSAEIKKDDERDPSPDVQTLLSVAEDAPVVKYVDSLVTRAIHERASDIHIEPERDSVSIRLRVDGKLRSTVSPPKSMQNAVISRIKILSGPDIAEKRLPLDGRLHLKFQGREVDLRVSTLPTIHGEKVVMRVLDKTAVNMELDNIGGEDAFRDHMKSILKRPNGIILVTGPTGSGKSTTLYACLNYVRSVTRNIVSVEDPVEYEMAGITQVAARPDIGMNFARALRAILRQDPDIVMVGEIRDLETLEIAIRASLTGHLVLSSLHTNDAVSTVTRMVNMGAEPYLIASTLLTAVAQRLLRRICKDCKQEYQVPDALRADLEARTGKPAPAKLWQGRGDGCAMCGETGYFGRTAVFEYFHVDEAARELITKNASESQLREHQRAGSSGTLFDNAFAKVLSGITTVEEALQFERKS